MNLTNTYYFLRHADTDRTRDVHFSEYELSADGHQQAVSIVEKISGLDIDLVYSSPFTRAKQTIEPFINDLKSKIIIEDRLSGRIVGNLPKSETWNFFEKSWADFEFREYGAESASECIERIKSFILSLEEQHHQQRILFVSHSNPIALFLSSFDNSVDYDWFRKMKSPSLFKIESVDGSLSFQELELI